MANNYATILQRDKGGEPMQHYAPPFKSLAVYKRDNGSASSVITLTDSTTTVEVSAVGATGYVRWIASSDTTASVVGTASGANFDHVIPAGVVVKLAVPKETGGTSSIVGVNVQEGLYKRLAGITVGVGSIMTNEF